MNLLFNIDGTTGENKYIISGYEELEPTWNPVVFGELSRFPGSPSIWVSHDLFVPSDHRRKGFAKQYNQRMLEHAWFMLDASAVVCSVKKDNDLQQGRLRKLGWERISMALWMIKPPTEWSNV